MSNVTVLFAGNDTVLEVRGLKDEVAGTFMNAATVTATVVDDTGSPIGGQAWPLTLAYVANSNGDYRATASHSMALVAGARYTMNLTADGGAGLVANWSVPCVARRRD